MQKDRSLLNFVLVLEIIRAAAQPMPCGSYLVKQMNGVIWGYNRTGDPETCDPEEIL